MPHSTIDPAEFDKSDVTATARRVLTERQLEVWVRTHRDGWSAFRIAQLLRLSTATIERDLADARRTLKEALAEKGLRSPFDVTIARNGKVETVIDATADGARRRLERGLQRRQRIPSGVGREKSLLEPLHP